MRGRTKLGIAVVVGANAGQAYLMLGLDWLGHHHPQLLIQAWPRLVAGAALNIFVLEAACTGALAGLIIKRRRAAKKAAAALVQGDVSARAAHDDASALRGDVSVAAAGDVSVPAGGPSLRPGGDVSSLEAERGAA